MKIFTNAYPRSGTTTFTTALIRSTEKVRKVYKDELYINDSWIIKNHNPILFLGNFSDDIIGCSIIRNPLDAVSSNVFRWSKGYTGNSVYGLLVVDTSKVYGALDIGEPIIKSIDHQLDQYISYMHCLLLSKSNVVLFTYEQMKSLAPWCIHNLVSIAGYDDSLVNDENAIYFVNSPENVSDLKNDLYFKIREYIENTEKYKTAIFYYDKVINLLKEKQDSYPIKDQSSLPKS